MNDHELEFGASSNVLAQSMIRIGLFHLNRKREFKKECEAIMEKQSELFFFFSVRLVARSTQ